MSRKLHPSHGSGICDRDPVELSLRLQIPDEKVTIISKGLKSRPPNREPVCTRYGTLWNSKACSLPFSLDLCLPDQAIESVPFQSQRTGRNMFPIIEPEGSIDQDQDPEKKDRRGLFLWLWRLINQKVLQSSHQGAERSGSPPSILFPDLCGPSPRSPLSPPLFKSGGVMTSLLQIQPTAYLKLGITAGPQPSLT